MCKWLVSSDNDTVRLFMIIHNDDSIEYEPVKISKSLIVKKDLTWRLFVNGVLVEKSPSISLFPELLTLDVFKDLIDTVSKCNICIGNADNHYVEMCQEKKGKIYSANREVVAYVHEGYPVKHNGSTSFKTVRHKSCQLLVTQGSNRCIICEKYQVNLRSIFFQFTSRKSSIDLVPKSNLRYMCTPERKRKYVLLRNAIINQRRRFKRLHTKLESISQGVGLDEEVVRDLKPVVHDFQAHIDQYGDDDFRKIFWNHQVKLMNTVNPNGRRYHPLFIRWCLNLMTVSPLAYNILKESNVFVMPSKRTLLDYTHWYSQKCGFQSEALEQLYQDLNVIDLNNAQ
jgi:hypothetical protein